ncbi:RING/U-box superfamily protein [Zea mays]|uniref:RING/U-box superfamily protein n=1 Tax=Zea mays TaxID=4577 RepID=A0A1D6LVN8_MAIZE|nr:RING/U-box superfamily protein [Zea mays]
MEPPPVPALVLAIDESAANIEGWTNSRADVIQRNYGGSCVQMRLSFSSLAPLFLYFIQWLDCGCCYALPSYLGLFHILMQGKIAVYADGDSSVSTYERRASLREFYGDCLKRIRSTDLWVLTNSNDVIDPAHLEKENVSLVNDGPETMQIDSPSPQDAARSWYIEIWSALYCRCVRLSTKAVGVQDYYGLLKSILLWYDGLCLIVTSLADPYVNIIFGAVVDDRYTGEIHVTIIAIGFPQSFQKSLLVDPKGARIVESKEKAATLAHKAAAAADQSVGAMLQELEKEIDDVDAQIGNL